ncbi:MAG: ribonuclease HII [Candidatus Saccharimonadales bacterium]
MVVVGIDEVGRGCWAGPLVAGAVVLGEPISGLQDSKKLSAKQRERLDLLIHESARAIGLGWIWPATIDEIGLTEAVRQAMQSALKEIDVGYDEVIIDGNLNFLEYLPKTRALIKADDSIPAVSAASIVAKVARDNYMTELALKLPEYGFEKHVGYGTASHLAALQAYGVTPHHRRSYKPVAALLQ